MRTSASFTNVNGQPANPDTATLKYKATSGSVITVSSPTHDGTGAYHYDIDTTGWTGPGNARYTTEWIGTGAVQTINSDTFEVEPPSL